MKKNILLPLLFSGAMAAMFPACLPVADPYPYADPAAIVHEAEAISDSLENYIVQWTQGLVSDSIPDHLIPEGISDSRDFYLKHPDSVSAEETWGVRFARPIDKDALLGGIPDPKVTYLFLGTALAPFGSKLVVEGEFPHCRFFSVQVTPPLNGVEYYAQRQFGSAEVSIVDADIQPLPGHVNPFVLGADRNATNRGYRLEIDLATGDPTSLNGPAHTYPYRDPTNRRKGAMLVYQGPLGHKTVAGTPLPAGTAGDWNLGALWIRIYEPDENTDSLGGVPMPKVYFELPNGEKYFIGSDFSRLQARADATIANRVVNTMPNDNYGPWTGWFKSWGITRSMLNGICIANAWDSAYRVRDIDLGWTGRGEFQPPPGNIEPHATTNNYASYLGTAVCVPPGMVAVLTGKLPTFPMTRNGEPVMTGGDVRYWSVTGIDTDPLSPMPATTVHAISDDDVLLDEDRNYVIAYSRDTDRPANATGQNRVNWVDWGTQSELGLLIRWVCVAPEWRFAFAPHEHNLDFSHSDFSGVHYDKSLIGENWRHGFMQCYLPRIHYMTKAEFEALGNDISAETIPVWVDSSFTRAGLAESRRGTISATSVADPSLANAAVNMIDGDMTTGWSSLWGQPDVAVVVDLDSVKTISAIKLNWDWIFFAEDYTLEVSEDGSSYSTIATADGENGVVDLYEHLQHVRGRYVKLHLTRYNLGFYRLLEFEVFTSDCDCDTDGSTSVQSVAHADHTNVELFPNPAGAWLQYRTSAAAPVDLEVYDLQGRLWRSADGMPPSGRIETGELPSGVYLLSVREKGRSAVVRRFVKSR